MQISSLSVTGYDQHSNHCHTTDVLYEWQMYQNVNCQTFNGAAAITFSLV